MLKSEVPVPAIGNDCKWDLVRPAWSDRKLISLYVPCNSVNCPSDGSYRTVCSHTESVAIKQGDRKKRYWVLLTFRTLNSVTEVQHFGAVQKC